MRERFPILFTFDFDAETLWLGRDPENERRPATLSQGRYGAVRAVPRILDLLDRQGLKVTWFVPGQVIELHREVVIEIHRRGHEIAHHGYTHGWPDSLSSEVQRAEFAKAYDLIAELTGTPPKGLRAPVMELTPTLLEELVRRDMLYSSNMMDDDRPYRHVVDGIKTGVVELPSCWLLDDAPFFLYSVRIPGRVMQSPDTVYQMWVAELEGLYAEPDTCFVIAFHPQVIGRPSRLAMLERFIEYAKAKPGAWLGRCDEIASDLRDRL